MPYTKVLIIGSGPAGYSAAIYAARANLSPIIIQGQDGEIGGQLAKTTDVENYPGFADTIQGPWLMEQMKLQTQNTGATLVEGCIKSCTATEDGFECIGFHETDNQEAIYQCKAIIIATGAQAKLLGINNEEKYLGYGVSGCATCDAPCFRNRDVIVIGGGNTAVEEALHLSKFAKKVILVHRRDKLRAEEILQERLLKNPKITIIWDHILADIIGNENPKYVTGAKLQSTKTGNTNAIDIDGIFIAIGHAPNTAIFKDIVERDNDEYIITKANSTCTSTPGIFAAGDVQDKHYRQAITSAGSGCMAALDAKKFLEDQEAI